MNSAQLNWAQLSWAERSVESPTTSNLLSVYLRATVEVNYHQLQLMQLTLSHLHGENKIANLLESKKKLEQIFSYIFII